MERYGLIGCGISQSLSKKIHEFSAGLQNRNLTYEIINLSSEKHLLKYMEQLRAGYWQGFNITTPFKSAVISHLDHANTASINTLWTQNGKLYGDSTDGLGFEKGLDLLDTPMSQLKKIGFLGSGGAVLGILEHLLAQSSGHRGSTLIFLVRNLQSKSVETILDFCQIHSLKYEITNQVSEFILKFQPSDEDQKKRLDEDISFRADRLLVNAVPKSESLPWNAHELISQISKNIAFYDLTYGAMRSSLYSLAKRHFVKVTDGLPMLIEQARQSEKIWWGSCPSYEKISGCLNMD